MVLEVKFIDHPGHGLCFEDFLNNLLIVMRDKQVSKRLLAGWVWNRGGIFLKES